MSNYKDLPPPYPGNDQVPGVHIYYGAPSQPGIPPQQPGYYGPSAPPNPGYGATTTTVIVSQPEHVMIGACPACIVGVLEDDFTCLGVLCAIFFFPLGILCCLALREKRCSKCGASFG